MNAEDMRALETIDLRAKVAALEEDLFKIRFQHATAQLSDTSMKTLAEKVHDRLVVAKELHLGGLPLSLTARSTTS